MSQKYTEQLRTLAEQERRRLEGGGFTLSLEELQQSAHEFACENAELEIQAYRVLEQVNDHERNRRIWDNKYHLYNSIKHNREVYRLNEEYKRVMAAKAERKEPSLSVKELKSNNHEAIQTFFD